jgi:hypothetical protein
MQFRNKAEELRIIAAEMVNGQAKDSLMGTAGEYDKIAALYELLVRSRNGTPETSQT